MDRARAQWIAVVLVAAAGIGAQTIRSTEPADPGVLNLAAADVAAADSHYVDERLDPSFERELRAREIVYRSYAPASETPVWLFMAYFDQQREGSQVHSPRHCYPGAGWGIEEEVEVPAAWRDGSVHGLVVSDGSERRLVCYWYQTPSTILSDVMKLKLALTREALLRKPQDVVFASVSTPVDGDIDAAYHRVLPLARAAEEQVTRLYRERDEHRPDIH
ncbi:MAG TPA: EpsI family protein [Candidatus Krumholzibacteria bacterium]|nr:EpsI family protein [Candidatus Krumholzibacteria bacterium]